MSGDRFWAGIDAGADSLAICVKTDDGNIVDRAAVPADFRAVCAYFSSLGLRESLAIGVRRGLDDDRRAGDDAAARVVNDAGNRRSRKHESEKHVRSSTAPPAAGLYLSRANAMSDASSPPPVAITMYCLPFLAR